jgi:plasmid stabilization system protein ParE
LKVIWTEQALVRLTEIQDFIARANPDAAEDLVHRIVERSDRPGTEVVLVGREGAGFAELVEGYEWLFGSSLKVWNATPGGFADFVQTL